MSTPDPTPPATLARRAREQFAAGVEVCLEPLASSIGSRLQELADRAPSTREAQIRRDALVQFERQRARWVEKTRRALMRAAQSPVGQRPVRAANLSLELIGDDVVEQKIIASRLAMAIHEKATWELNDLKVRMQELEERDDFASDDLLRPDTLSLLMVEQWMDSDLSRQTWLLISDIVQQQIVPAAVETYGRINYELISAGVVPDIDLSRKVKRGGSAVPRRAAAADAPPDFSLSNSRPAELGGASGGGWSGQLSGVGPNPAGTARTAGGAPAASFAPGAGVPGAASAGASAGFGGGSSGGFGADSWSAAQPSMPNGWQGSEPGAGGHGAGQAGAPGRSNAHPGATAGDGSALAFPALPGTGAGHVPAGGAAATQAFSAPAGTAYSNAAAAGTGAGPDSGRASTASSPLVRARAKAQGVLGQLKRLLSDRIAGFDPEQVATPSPALSQALSVQSSHVQTHVHDRGAGADDSAAMVYDNAAVQQVARELRERTGELKQQAATSGEKAVIEIVALMFQSILSEDRIPPAVRVWFARLQMPVLRVALSEPEFFGSLQHPARQLIDRMGSCVLGFDAAAIGGSTLEAEIRRVVQLIEQYPETGRKVFQLAFEEFQKFLSRYLTERGQTQRLVSVAQQVEQKETMSVRYTIELRKMLHDMPVRDEIREFLFKVWAEVMAVAAVKNGASHADTLALKKSASELVWAASAKPNRAERAQVIQGLPSLLQRLRQGMSMLGLDSARQEEHIKRIGDTLADAFQSKTAAIPVARIEAIAQRLANLEDFVGDDPEGDLPLVAESIELMLGMDNVGIDVITDGGSPPNAAMLAWARELQPGTWFSLDHNGQVHQVQYAWRSERGQLHLFASITGRSFLIQAGRLAAYLQAGLMLPAEEEALTVRATREALAKIDANPERLFA